MYGTATWNAYRVPSTSAEYMSIEDVLQCARDVAGNDHHFKVVQLPYNLAMPEAYTSGTQQLRSRSTSIIEACQDLNVAVMTSASIFQSRLARNLPGFVVEHLTGLNTDAQRAIQFARSTPGVTTALVGMSHLRHVDENMGIVKIAPSADSVRRMLNAP
jgi:predicted aldo/keto reductase-like oxidoreductase